MPCPIIVKRMLLLVFLLTIVVWGGCAEDNPNAPGSILPSGTIDSTGGTLTLNENTILYVPPGAVTGPEAFHLAEASGVPAPPAGCVSFGAAVAVEPQGRDFRAGLSLGFTFDYHFYDDERGLSGRPVRLDRLGADGTWQPVQAAGAYFPLALVAPVHELGTFAVHVDTTDAQPGEIHATFSLVTDYSIQTSGVMDWKTTFQAGFTDPVDGSGLMAAGPVEVGNVALTYYGGGKYLKFENIRAMVPGGQYEVAVPGGNGISPLSQAVVFFAQELVLTFPVESDLEVDRNSPLVVTWEGTGPELVWLFIGGRLGEGWSGLTPNDGEFEVTPEILQGFSPNDRQQVFLQRSRLEPLTEAGYDAGSYIILGTTSSCSFIVP